MPLRYRVQGLLLFFLLLTVQPVLAQNSSLLSSISSPAATINAFGSLTHFNNPVITVLPGQPVMLGFAAPLTGDGLAPLGIDVQRGAELALLDRPTVNVFGVDFPVSLDVKDSGCSAATGTDVANEFINDSQIVGVVGPLCSSSCTAAAPIFDEAGYTTISPGCTAPALTTSGFTSFNRTPPSDAQQAVDAAKFAFFELGIQRIATIHDGSPYGEGLINNMETHFRQLGGEIVTSEAISIGDTDFTTVLETIASTDAELIYFGGFTREGAGIATQRIDLGLGDVMMGGDGLRLDDFISLAGDAAEGVYTVVPQFPSSDYVDEYLDNYIQQYGEEPPAPFGLYSYDAVTIFLNAIETVGITNKDGILTIERTDLMAYIRTAELDGRSGKVICDGTGECSEGNVLFFVVEGGEFVRFDGIQLRSSDS